MEPIHQWVVSLDDFYYDRDEEKIAQQTTKQLVLETKEILKKVIQATQNHKNFEKDL